jgi:hypothetical protein
MQGAASKDELTTVYALRCREHVLRSDPAWYHAEPNSFPAQYGVFTNSLVA